MDDFNDSNEYQTEDEDEYTDFPDSGIIEIIHITLRCPKSD